MRWPNVSSDSGPPHSVCSYPCDLGYVKSFEVSCIVLTCIRRKKEKFTPKVGQDVLYSRYCYYCRGNKNRRCSKIRELERNII